MKSLMLAFIVFACHAFADYQEIKSVVNTQSTRDADNVKRLEKSGMLHTGNQLNKRLKNVRVSIDREKGEVKIDFDYPTLEWALGPVAYPFWINLADKNGNILDKFKTTEDFVPKGVYERTQPGTVGRSYLDESKGKQRKAFLMKPTGNTLRYDVNMRDAPHVEIVEIGFMTTMKTRIHNAMDEFVPEKIFIKDWSKEKEYK